MKRFIHRFRLELTAITLLSLFCFIISLWTKYKPANHYVQLCLALVLLAVGIPLYLVLRKIWRTKLREPLALGAKRLFISASRLFMRVISKWSIFKRHGNVISGRTSVSYDFSVFSKDNRRKKQKPAKALRWKDMQNSRERLGYLYYKTVTNRIKGGETVTAHETPNEIMARFTDNETENEMFALYVITRYDDRITLDDDRVIDLKEKLFD